jgi:polyhydroxybutyrate depolymerase
MRRILFAAIAGASIVVLPLLVIKAPKWLGWVLIPRIDAGDYASQESSYCRTAALVDPRRQSTGENAQSRALAGYQTLAVDGEQRRFYLESEPPSAPYRKVPLIIALHGSASSGERLATDARLSAKSCGEVAVAYPDGTRLPGGRGVVAWDDRSPVSGDTRFIETIISWMSEHRRVDTSLVFVVGFSAGGWFANHLACYYPNLIRGIVPIAAAGPFARCKHPVAAMVMHSSKDKVAPISLGWRSLYTWRTLSNCSSSKLEWAHGPCYQFAHCRAEAPVMWCEYAGSHEWPKTASLAILEWVFELTQSSQTN